VTTSAASFTSKSLGSLPPVTFRRTRRPVDRLLEERTDSGRAASLPGFPEAMPMPMSELSRMIVRTSAKSRLTMPAP
jgi:hypothetical protein